MTTTLCIACGAIRDPGALLEVRPVNPLRATFTVCRPTVSPPCFPAAETAADHTN